MKRYVVDQDLDNHWIINPTNNLLCCQGPAKASILTTAPQPLLKAKSSIKAMFNLIFIGF